MRKLKLQYFGHLIRRADSWEDPDAGKDWGQEEKERQRMTWLDGIVNTMDLSLRKLRKMVKDREACCAAAHGVVKSQRRFSDWTTTEPSEMRITIFFVCYLKTEFEKRVVSMGSGQTCWKKLFKQAVPLHKMWFLNYDQSDLSNIKQHYRLLFSSISVTRDVSLHDGFVFLESLRRHPNLSWNKRMKCKVYTHQIFYSFCTLYFFQQMNHFWQCLHCPDRIF